MTIQTDLWKTDEQLKREEEEKRAAIRCPRCGKNHVLDVVGLDEEGYQCWNCGCEWYKDGEVYFEGYILG